MRAPRSKRYGITLKFMLFFGLLQQPHYFLEKYFLVIMCYNNNIDQLPHFAYF